MTKPTRWKRNHVSAIEEVSFEAGNSWARLRVGWTTIFGMWSWEALIDDRWLGTGYHDDKEGARSSAEDCLAGWAMDIYNVTKTMQERRLSQEPDE